MDFRQRLYIPSINRLALNLPHIHIIVTRHCGNTCLEVFKSRAYYQDVLCHRDYIERVVANFSHQIKSEYYVGNRYMSIEGVALKHFSATNQGYCPFWDLQHPKLPQWRPRVVLVLD